MCPCWCCSLWSRAWGLQARFLRHQVTFPPFVTGKWILWEDTWRLCKYHISHHPFAQQAWYPLAVLPCNNDSCGVCLIKMNFQSSLNPTEGREDKAAWGKTTLSLGKGLSRSCADETSSSGSATADSRPQVAFPPPPGPESGPRFSLARASARHLHTASSGAMGGHQSRSPQTERISTSPL